MQKRSTWKFEDACLFFLASLWKYGVSLSFFRLDFYCVLLKLSTCLQLLWISLIFDHTTMRSKHFWRSPHYYQCARCLLPVSGLCVLGFPYLLGAIRSVVPIETLFFRRILIKLRSVIKFQFKQTIPHKTTYYITGPLIKFSEHSNDRTRKKIGTFRTVFADLRCIYTQS